MKSYLIAIGTGVSVSQVIDHEALAMILNAVISIITVFVTKKAKNYVTDRKKTVNKD